MTRQTHKLTYRSIPGDQVEGGLDVIYLLDSTFGQECDCLRKLKTDELEAFDSFIERHQLHYCKRFEPLVGDKCSLYADADLYRVYWFHDCCSMGDSYRILVAVTDWPIIEPVY